MDKPEMWNSEERRLERKRRLDSLKSTDGGKKPIRKGGTFTRIFLPIIAVVLILAVGVWAAIQFALPQKLFPPMSIDGKKISSAEFSYVYYGVLSSLSIDPSTDEGKKKLKELCTEEDFTDVTWRDYAYDLAAKQVVESHILYTLATEKGLALEDTDKTEIDSIFDNLIEQLGSKVEADKYLMDLFGKDVTMKSLRPVFEKMTLGDKYATEQIEKTEVSDQEIEAVYLSNKDDYDAVTFRLMYFSVDNDADATDEEKEAAKSKAEKDAESFLEEVTDSASFKLLAEQKQDADEKAAYEKLTNEEKVEADKKKEEEQKKVDDLLATMTDDEKAEYEASEANTDSYLINSMSKKDLEGANQDLAEWLFSDERKSGDKEVFDFTTGYYAVYFISRDAEFSLPSVRHILISPNEEKDTSAGDVFTKEEWDAARVLAGEVLGKCTDKATFIEMVTEYSSDPGSVTNGGLYESVTRGQMMPAFDAWSFDASRKPGDMGIVRTPYGFHIMWFEGLTESTSLSRNSDSIKTTLAQEKFKAELEENKDLEKFQYTIHSFGVKLTDLG
ncbi:MAG: peptidylprolyl isomerase [Eubacteriales bacterium]|nr:peptidylprolyl isomerase [Eubacteriales bacterium]MDD4326716.1 peptidylprolyl isomerase [Eubacteriales bacterium]MDD4716741.1 peptidylprolyl isomerase [Eubacteriales bacterium]